MNQTIASPNSKRLQTAVIQRQKVTAESEHDPATDIRPFSPNHLLHSQRIVDHAIIRSIFRNQVPLRNLVSSNLKFIKEQK